MISRFSSVDGRSNRWLFWLAPIAGAALAGVAYRFLGEERKETEPAFADRDTLMKVREADDSIKPGAQAPGSRNKNRL
jgi:hypothetical protein